MKSSSRSSTVRYLWELIRSYKKKKIKKNLKSYSYYEPDLEAEKTAFLEKATILRKVLEV